VLIAILIKNKHNINIIFAFNAEMLLSTVHSIFKKDLNPFKMVQELEIFTGQKITPGKTLLF